MLTGVLLYPCVSVCICGQAPVSCFGDNAMSLVVRKAPGTDLAPLPGGVKIGGREMKYFFLALAVFLMAGYVKADQYYSHNDYGNYGNNDSYQQGYVEGYGHGARDSQSRLDFNFRHASAYQNSDSDCGFRIGYIEGYADGYFRKQPIVDLRYGGGFHHDHDGDYDNDDYGYNSEAGRGFGGVTVFTRTGFGGFGQTFGIGQYRHLTGNLNDSIESVRVNGNVRVILFDLSDFRGPRVVLDRDTWDLGGFNRRAASMIIEPVGY